MMTLAMLVTLVLLVLIASSWGSLTDEGRAR
jgi:hypothetical protein